MAKGKKTAPRRRTASKAPKATTTHTISEDGLTVTRHHPEGDSVQNFGSTEGARDYAASIPKP
jgi:hypothetical protein